MPVNKVKVTDTHIKDGGMAMLPETMCTASPCLPVGEGEG
jgi:hypothetical protein